MAWSPDGAFIVFVSSRLGFKDEAPYTDAPQPYGDVFVMRNDGTDVQQLTDNQWEGTPVWQPPGEYGSARNGDRRVACDDDRGSCRTLWPREVMA